MELSYSQNLEDYHLSLAFAGQATGTYIDIGAGHPIADNVSFWFYERGWSGVVVEPQSTLAALYPRLRPRDIAVTGLVGRECGEIDFHVVDRLHGLSTTVEGAAQAAQAFGVRYQTTRMAVTTEKEADAQSGDNRTMGRKHILPYGLYRAHGFVSAKLAERTGFSDDDLQLLWRALTNMFEHDRSAARGEMAARKLIVFEHENAMGNAPAHVLFDAVKVERASDASEPARTFKDYRVSIDRSAIPSSVSVQELL